MFIHDKGVGGWLRMLCPYRAPPPKPVPVISGKVVVAVSGAFICIACCAYFVWSRERREGWDTDSVNSYTDFGDSPPAKSAVSCCERRQSPVLGVLVERSPDSRLYLEAPRGYLARPRSSDGNLNVMHHPDIDPLVAISRRPSQERSEVSSGTSVADEVEGGRVIHI